MKNKKYQIHIITARSELREGKVIQAYDTLGNILEAMEVEDDK